MRTTALPLALLVLSSACREPAQSHDHASEYLPLGGALGCDGGAKVTGMEASTGDVRCSPDLDVSTTGDGLIAEAGSLSVTFPPPSAAAGTATTVARSDHLHDARYVPLTFPTPLVFKRFVPIHAFAEETRPSAATQVVLSESGLSLGAASSAFTVKLFAPVQLPQGAEVTSFGCWYHDGHGTQQITELTGNLVRVQHGSHLFDVMATITADSTGAGSQLNRHITTTAVTSNPINNSTHSTLVTVRFTTTGPSVFFRGCDVDFEVSSLGH